MKRKLTSLGGTGPYSKGSDSFTSENLSLIKEAIANLAH